jgi:membrane fusion protein (multidrug efflux system)
MSNNLELEHTANPPADVSRRPQVNGHPRVTESPSENDHAAPEEKSPKSKKTAFIIFAAVLLIGALSAGAYWLHSLGYEETDDAFIDGHIVAISPQVMARVASVQIDDNQLVKAGELLVELDPTDYEAALAEARGSEASAVGKLDEARAQVAVSDSQVVQAQAELDSAAVTFENADRDLRRYQNLDDRSKSRQQLDNATATQRTSAASVAQAKSKLEMALAQVQSAKATVTSAQGNLEQARAATHRAEVNLGYCRISAPLAGRITRKDVEPGQYVTSATELFSIVPDDVWVTANFKETQLQHMKAGDAVEVSVDAYPDRKVFGHVQSIQAGTGSRFSIIPAENATGNYVKVVQRVPVKIVLDGDVNSDTLQLLSPGMSVMPTVTVK